MDQNSDNAVSNHLTRIGKNTLIYSVGNIATKAVSFLLIPLYTNYLSVSEVGIVVLLELFELLYLSVAPLGIVNAIWRFYYLAKEDKRERIYLSSNYFFLLASSLLGLVPLLVSSSFLARHILTNQGYTNLLQVFFSVLFLSLPRFFMQSLLRIIEKPILYILLVFFDFLFLLSLTLWFIIGQDLGLWGIVYAKLITAGVVFVFTTLYVVIHFGIHFKLTEVTRSLKYGLPLIFHGMGLLILNMADRYFIKELISIEAVAIYGIAYKFGMIINMVLVTPFIHAWQPLLFRLENRPDQKLIYQKVGLHYVQIAAIAWLAISLLAKYMLRLTTTEEYYAGAIIIPWITFSYFLYGLQNIFKAGALIHHKTMQMMIITLSAAATNIFLNLVLIPKWGITGAAIATVIAFLLMLSLILFLSEKYLPINWRWQKMISIVVLSVLTYGFALIEINDLHKELVRDFATLLALPILMIALKLVSLTEITRFVRNFRKGF